MKKITLNELKKIQLDILIYIDKICKDNNIQYSLAYGTLIGAVRHKGYIPWDDDIDILLKRSEYNKLLNILHKEKNEKYKVFSQDDEGYYYTYTKVSDSETIIHEKNWPQYKDLGVNIDIFPIDYVPNGKEKEHYEKTMFYVRCLHNCLTDIAYAHDKRYMRFIKKLCRFRTVKKCRAKGEKFWKDKINEMTQTEKANNMACIIDGDYCLWNQKILDNYIEIEFEGHLFDSVKDYDTMLKNYYGDYMQILPEEERKTNHNFVAYWKKE